MNGGAHVWRVTWLKILCSFVDNAPGAARNPRRNPLLFVERGLEDLSRFSLAVAFCASRSRESGGVGTRGFLHRLTSMLNGKYQTNVRPCRCSWWTVYPCTAQMQQCPIESAERQPGSYMVHFTQHGMLTQETDLKEGQDKKEAILQAVRRH